MKIYRIRIKAIHPDMTHHDVMAFRVAAETEEDAEGVGRIVWTKWMKAHPRVPSMMALDWPSPHDLGETTPYWRV